MMFVLNKCYGGFSFSEEACDILGLESPYEEVDRVDSRAVAVVLLLGARANGFCADLRVVEIPDEATDWRIDEYDGFESVVYVVDGKLHWA